MKRIKVFLGGYINYTNAQNLNCKAIAKHIDKSKFEVYTMQVHFGKERNFDINTFNCFKPFSLSKHLGFLWGILNCDVIYLPKHIGTPIWVVSLAKRLKKPIFTTIEGNVLDRKKDNLIDLYDNDLLFQKYFSFFDEIFPITKHLSKQSNHLIKINKRVLSLGVDYNSFLLDNIKQELKQIIFVGGIIKRKRVDEFIKLAQYFPSLSFVIVGDGNQKGKLEKNSYDNVKFLGKLEHEKIKTVFKESDLLFLPSKSEGFPKVILEAGSAGIPSIVYKDYGASEWINTGNNGFVVSSFDEVLSIIKKLMEEPGFLAANSKNVKKLAQSFDWNIIIKNWEKEIIKLANKKID